MKRVSLILSGGLVSLFWAASSFATGATEGKMCGGIAGITCKSGLYCDLGSACGFGDQSGKCKKKPKSCALAGNRVCGCDGKTYVGNCSAAKVGVSIKSNGPCSGTGAAEGQTCGGIAGITCKSGLYCDLGAACGFGDQSGKCKKKPTSCPLAGNRICGCDGKTYLGTCAAAKAGVSVKSSSGECAGAAGAACGSRGLPPCGDGLYCNFESGCGADDRPGKCALKTKQCTMIYMPVCGCDGKTYGNKCAAAGAGVSVKAQGACH